MAEVSYAKSPHRKKVERINPTVVKQAIREVDGGRFVFVEKNTIVVSSQAGYLLGETVRDSLNSTSFIYLGLADVDTVAVVVAKDDLIIIDDVVSGTDWRFLLQGVLGDIETIFVHPKLQEALLDYLGAQAVNIKVKPVEEGHFQSLKPTKKLLAERKYFSKSGSKKPVLLLIGGVVALAIYWFNREPPKPPEDPFLQYRSEVNVGRVGDGLDQGINTLLAAASGLKSWVVQGLEIYPDSIKVKIVPVSDLSKLAEARDYASSVNAQFEPIPGGAQLSFALYQESPISNKIWPLMDLAVVARDAVAENSLFSVAYSGYTDKGNYETLEASVAGYGVGVDELNMLAQLFKGWPLVINKVTISRNNDNVDLIYSVDIKAKFVGGKK